MNNPKNGMTIIELLVAACIALCLGYAIHSFFSHASRLAAIAETNGMIRQEAQIILRALERDVSSSRVVVDKDGLLKDNTERYKPDFTRPNENSLMLHVPKNAKEKNSSAAIFDTVESDDADNYDEVVYEWGADGKITRKQNNKTQLLGRHLSKLEIPETYTYDGKIELTLDMSAIPRGLKTPATHTEKLIISIRALQNKMLEETDGYSDGRTNKYWRQKIRPDGQN